VDSFPIAVGYELGCGDGVKKTLSAKNPEERQTFAQAMSDLFLGIFAYGSNPN
jgi:hypothetical protein